MFARLKYKIKAFAPAVLFLIGAIGTAQADVTLQLTQDNCSGGCNPNPPNSMGTVLLQTVTTGEVEATITLVSPLEFVNTGLVDTIDFNLNGITTGVSANNFSDANFSLSSGTAGANHFDGFGDFQYAILLNTAQGAGGAQNASPLTFDVFATGLTENSFVGNNSKTGNWFFGVDVYNPANGHTGPIGATMGTSTVPEPKTVSLLLILMTFAAILIRSRKRAVVTE